MGRGAEAARGSHLARHLGVQLHGREPLLLRRRSRQRLGDRPCRILVGLGEALRLHQAGGEEGRDPCLLAPGGHEEGGLPLQRVPEHDRGLRLRESLRHHERGADVQQLFLARDDLRDELQQHGALGIAHVQRVLQARGRHGRLRALQHERGERVQDRDRRRAHRPERRCAHVVLGHTSTTTARQC